MAIVGSSVVVGKLALERFPVFLLSALRFGIAALILVPLVLATQRGVPRLTRGDAGVLLLQTVTGIFGFNVLLLHGLTLTSASESGIVTATTPAVAGVLAVLLLRERLTRGGAAALGLAMLGLVLMNVLGAGVTAQRGPNPLLGDLLVFGAVVCEGLFVVCSRVLAQRLPPLVVATGMTLLGLAMFAPFALAEACRFEFTAVTARDWVAVGYYGVAVTVVAFLFWTHGVGQVPASTAAVFTGVLPVSAVTLSWLVLGEPMLASHLIGGACVLGAIGLTARRGEGAATARALD
jgi:drug/metabolite transporter (DMT)-like permease